jgi:CheY-like chemotaxis protein
MEKRSNGIFSAAKRLILADDDADDRDLFEEALNLLNPAIKITMAKDGEELMQILTTSPVKPDAIFLDLNMPRKNGKECLAEIQANNDLKSIPVIIYSTSISRRDVDECYGKGATDFILKPNSFDELKEILRNLFDNKSQTAKITR